MEPTEEQARIIADEKLGLLATLRRDGQPQITPVNYAYQDGRILISTTRDRAKYHNVRRDPRVSLCILRPEGRPYVAVYGRAEVQEDGIAPGTAEIFRRIYDRPLPGNFEEALRDQGRVLIILTPERFVP